MCVYMHVQSRAQRVVCVCVCVCVFLCGSEGGGCSGAAASVFSSL